MQRPTRLHPRPKPRLHLRKAKRIGRRQSGKRPCCGVEARSCWLLSSDVCLTLALITDTCSLIWVASSALHCILWLKLEQATWKLKCARPRCRTDMRAPANGSDVLLILPQTACHAVVAPLDTGVRMIENTMAMCWCRNCASPCTHLC